MPKESSSLKRGANHLLVVGINAYDRLQKLDNAVRDAQAFRDVLLKRYRFEADYVYELYDAEANRRNILREMRGLVSKLKADDSVIIYFSGHGHYDPVFGEGYWVPVDATFEVVDDYIPYTFLQQMARAIPARHLLMIADSCYSGAVLVREKDTVKERFERDPSRWMIASGRNEVVPDNGIVDRNHSPFASELLDLLRNYSEEGLTTQMLIARLTENVSYNSKQAPIGQALQNVGHKGGQFIFYPRKNEKGDWAKAKETHTTLAYRQFLKSYPQSSHADEALWQITSLTNTKKAFRNYLDKGGKFEEEANKGLGKIEEKDNFEKACLRGEAELRRFMRIYPNSVFLDKARAEITRIRAQEREPDAWREAQTAGTIEALQKYLDVFPDGIHASEARQLKSRLTADREAAEALEAEHKRKQAEAARKATERREAEARAREAQEQEAQKRQQAKEEARRRKEEKRAATVPLLQRPPVRYGLIGIPILALLIWGIPKLTSNQPSKGDWEQYTRLMQEADSTFKAGRSSRELTTVEQAGYLYKQAGKLTDSPKPANRSQLVNKWIMAYNDSLKKPVPEPPKQTENNASPTEVEAAKDPIQSLREQGYSIVSSWEKDVAIYKKESEKIMGLVNRNGQLLGREYYKVEELANGYAVFHKGGKRGYLNLEGKEVIAARYDAAWPFDRSRQAKVKEGSKTFFINTTGTCVKGCEEPVAAKPAKTTTNDPKEVPIPKMKRISGGTFLMGSNDGDSDEKPVHKVNIRSFEIGVYEVTQREWKAVMGSNPSKFKCDNCPVEMVSWDDVQKYIRKLNQLTGFNFRLPTEAEWEYAAGGGMTDRNSDGSRKYTYAGSNSLDSYGWYSSNSGSKTHPVGQKYPNGLGLYDMSGNVWEWCLDWYDSDYYLTCNSQGTVSNSQGPNSGQFRVHRGGSWSNDASYCRVAFRLGNRPDLRFSSYGFRLARTL
jgi:formylglycine-generating enzyme required for sulfatase activity/flagellar biosynthesis GTPase FlhF